METNNPKTSSEILNDAAKLIEKHGWRQKNFGNEVCGFCAFGALAKAAGFDDADVAHSLRYDDGAFADAYLALLQNTANICNGVFRWNDVSGRTKEEVIAKLKQTALQVNKETHYGN